MLFRHLAHVNPPEDICLFVHQFVKRAPSMLRATKFGYFVQELVGIAVNQNRVLTGADIILVNPASALDFALFVENDTANLTQQSVLDYACLRWTGLSNEVTSSTVVKVESLLRVQGAESFCRTKRAYP